MTIRPTTRAARKSAADPRHAEVKELLAKYWKAENEELPDMPWGAADAGALAQFLRSNPHLTVPGIRRMLINRYQSEDHAPGEPVFVWIKYLTRYLQGPLNKYRQPMEGRTDGTRKADQRNAHAVDATRAALARVRGVADRGDR